jgi:hypothetical protein
VRKGYERRAGAAAAGGHFGVRPQPGDGGGGGGAHAADGVYSLEGVRALLSEGASARERARAESVAPLCATLAAEPTEGEVFENSQCGRCRIDWGRTGPVCAHCRREDAIDLYELSLVAFRRPRRLDGVGPTAAAAAAAPTAPAAAGGPAVGAGGDGDGGGGVAQRAPQVGDNAGSTRNNQGVAFADDAPAVRARGRARDRAFPALGGVRCAAVCEGASECAP